VATTTTKLALTKPDGTDLVDIAVLNANADKIDTASGAFVCTSTTRPASPWNGQLIFETDTLNALVYRTSSTSWNIVGGSTVSSDPPANAGSGNFWWDSDNGKLYIYYNDGNTSQWVSANSNTSGVPIVGNAAGRDSLYPTPAQGNSVFRNDLGYQETYYALYNATTNPGGMEVAGWYKAQNNVGLVPVVPTGVSSTGGSTSFNLTTGLVTFSSVTQVNISGCFTGNYKNYLVLFTTEGGSDGTLYYRMLNGTTAETGSVYGYSGQSWQFNDTQAYMSFNGQTTQFQASNGPGPYKSNITTFISPNEAKNTYIQNETISNASSTNNLNYVGRNGGRVATSTQYTGLIAYGPTMSGTVKIYGYN
jgi:hypothetical protein